jgi:S1-C subfamily serine protease
VLASALAGAALTAAALLAPASPLSPAGSLSRQEAATVALFEAARPGVVFITALGERRDSFTLDVTETPQGAGSGVVWDDRFHIVTNAHVVRGAADLRVTLASGEDYAARVIGSDLDRDVAVLELGAPVPDDGGLYGGGSNSSADSDAAVDKKPASSPAAPPARPRLTPIPRGASSSLRVGQTVFAIGAPFGLDHTLTSGILSGLEREVPSGITGR